MNKIWHEFTQNKKGSTDVQAIYEYKGKHYLGSRTKGNPSLADKLIAKDMSNFLQGDSTAFKAGRLREISGDELDSFLNSKQSSQRRGATSGEEESMENRIMDSWGKKLGSQIGRLFGK